MKRTALFAAAMSVIILSGCAKVSVNGVTVIGGTLWHGTALRKMK